MMGQGRLARAKVFMLGVVGSVVKQDREEPGSSMGW